MNFLPGPMELILILVIVAMLFGVGKLPEVFGAVGKGIKEFRKEATDADSKASTEPAAETPAQIATAPVTAAPVVVAPVAEISTEKVEQA